MSFFDKLKKYLTSDKNKDSRQKELELLNDLEREVTFVISKHEKTKSATSNNPHQHFDKTKLSSGGYSTSGEFKDASSLTSGHLIEEGAKQAKRVVSKGSDSAKSAQSASIAQSKDNKAAPHRGSSSTVNSAINHQQPPAHAQIDYSGYAQVYSKGYYAKNLSINQPKIPSITTLKGYFIPKAEPEANAATASNLQTANESTLTEVAAGSNVSSETNKPLTSQEKNSELEINRSIDIAPEVLEKLQKIFLPPETVNTLSKSSLNELPSAKTQKAQNIEQGAAAAFAKNKVQDRAPNNPPSISGRPLHSPMQSSKVESLSGLKSKDNTELKAVSTPSPETSTVKSHKAEKHTGLSSSKTAKKYTQSSKAPAGLLRNLLMPFRWLLSLKGLALVAAAVVLFFAYILWDLPDYKSITNYQADTVSRIYSSDNKVLQELGIEKRSFTTISDIPALVKEAFISAEDKTFYTNCGFDFKGIGRALINNIVRIVKPELPLMGASTITQQVVKNILLTQDRTIIRKAKEAILTIKINHNLTKDRILELYLNQIYLGRGSYGVTTAALNYFNKPLASLTLPEVAFLAILPRSPNGFNPERNYDGAKSRRDILLNKMCEEGKITKEEALSAIATPIILAQIHKVEHINYSDYANDEVRKQLANIVSSDVVYKKGLIIKTTINLKLQRYAYNALRKGLQRIDQLQGYRGPAGNVYKILADSVAEDKNVDSNPGESNDEDVNDTNEPQAGDLDNMEQKEEALRTKNVATDPALLTERDVQTGQLNWRKALYTFISKDHSLKHAKLETWQPAVVLQVEDKNIQAGLSDGSVQGLQLEANSWAYPNKAAYKLIEPTTSLTSFKAILKPGDIVYLSKPTYGKNKGKWLLEQVPAVNGALIAMNPINGYVLAMQGGYSYGLSKFNRATQAYRQPGSSFKAFVYLTALRRGMTPATLVLDAPYTSTDTFTMWRPKNSGARYAGYVTMRNALEFSRNLASIRIAQFAGLSNISHVAELMGIYDDKLQNFSQVIGSKETTLLRLVRAYSIIANGGKMVQPVLIKDVVDRKGDIIYKATKAQCLECQNVGWKNQLPPELLDGREQVIDARDSYLITHMLVGVVNKGIGWRARVKGYDIGGKTGTTNDCRDLWFFGITPQLVVGVFVGKDNPQPLYKAMASSAVIPIFYDFASKALPAVADKVPFKVPDGITMSYIDEKTGKLVSPDTKGAFLESFRTDNMPKETEPNPQTAELDQSNRVATGVPEDNKEDNHLNQHGYEIY